jgi:hypothetical protein
MEKESITFYKCTMTFQLHTIAGSIQKIVLCYTGVPRNFVWGVGSAKSVEGRGQRERRSGGGNPLVRGSAELANE